MNCPRPKFTPFHKKRLACAPAPRIAAAMLLLLFLPAPIAFAQVRELPASSLQRKLNWERAQGVLPSSWIVSPENSPLVPSAAANWMVGTSYPTGIARYGFVQVGNDFYVISGETAGGLVATVRRYNAVTNVWTSLMPIPVGSEAPAAAYSSDNNKIYVVDGSGGNEFRIYDIATNSWTTGAARPGFTNGYGVAAGAYLGKVYVVGGEDSTGADPTLSIYDIASNSWTTGPVAPAAYQLGGYTQIGRFLYVVGGFGPTNANSNATMRLDMLNSTWSTGPVFTPQRADFALATNGSKLFAIGGDATGGDIFNTSALVDELDITAWPSGSWASSPPNLPTARQANSAGFFSTGRVGGEIWSTGGFRTSVLSEHLFRANVLQLTSAVSRKSHGGVPFDIDLPLAGTPGVECRTGGAGGDHALVFTFTTNVISGSAAITEGSGLAGAATFSGNNMTVPLSGVTDVQKITVTLSGVTDASAQVLPSTSVSMNVLLGDTTGNKVVNATDVSQTKLQSGGAVSAASFRNDTNVSGSISGTDVSQVKLNTGHGLP